MSSIKQVSMTFHEVTIELRDSANKHPNGAFDFEHHDSVEAQFGTWKCEILSLTNP
jgi:hypothetical protein